MFTQFDVTEIMLFNTALPLSGVSAVTEYFRAKSPLPVVYNFNLEGDSISDSDPNRWTAYFKPLLDAHTSGETYNIWALSGDTAANMVGEYATQAHTAYNPTLKNIYALGWHQ